MRRFFKRRLLPALAVVCLLIVAGLSLLWWRLPSVLNYLADRQLPQLGLEEARLRVERADSRRLVVRDAVLADTGFRAELDRVDAWYSPRQLWEERGVEQLRLAGLEAMLDWEPFTDAWLGSDEPATLDLGWIERLPARRVEFADMHVTLRHGELGGPIRADGRLRKTAPDAAEVEVSVRIGGALTQIRAKLKVGEPAQIAVESSTPDLLVLLERYVPGWRQRAGVVDGLELAVGGLAVEAELQVTEALAASGTANLRVDRLGARMEGGEAALGPTVLEVRFPSLEQLTGRLTTEVKELSWEEFALAEQALALEFGASDLRTWTLAWAEPLRWSYDADTAAGAFTLAISATLPEAEEPIAFDATAEVSELSASGYALAPFSVHADGTSEALDFGVSELRSIEYPSVRLQELEGSVERAADGSASARAQGRIAEDAGAALVSGLKSAPIQLMLDGKLRESGVEARLELISPEDPSALAALEDLFSVRGRVKLTLRASSPDPATRWGGEVELTTDELLAEGEGWSADGLYVNSRWTLEAGDWGARVAEAAGDHRALIPVVAGALEGQLTWQANGIRIAELAELQWPYGEVRMPAPDVEVTQAEPLSLLLSASVGILQVTGESLNQVDLALTTSGRPELLRGEGALDFRYAGAASSVAFEHQIEEPLGRLRVQGSYRLEPLVFDYSDVLGRKVPALEGLSFSGALSAEGRYWKDPAGADASAEVRFRDGSFNYPPSSLSAEGVDATLGLASIAQMRGAQESSTVSARVVRAGDIALTDGHVRFRTLDAQRVQLEEARIEIFDGSVRIQPATVSLEPLAVESRALFEEISLGRITEQMAFFDGRMEGAVTGYLPIRVVDGELRPAEGLLVLPEDETAQLRYNAQDLFPPSEGSKPTLGDRVLKLLRLEPERVVEDALADLAIHELEVRLFSPDTPFTPVQVRLAGEARTGETRIPLSLTTNVNGTLEELYNFLIRINSLGSVSF